MNIDRFEFKYDFVIDHEEGNSNLVMGIIMSRFIGLGSHCICFWSLTKRKEKVGSRLKFNY